MDLEEKVHNQEKNIFLLEHKGQQEILESTFSQSKINQQTESPDCLKVSPDEKKISFDNSEHINRVIQKNTNNKKNLFEALKKKPITIEDFKEGEKLTILFYRQLIEKYKRLDKIPANQEELAEIKTRLNYFLEDCKSMNLNQNYVSLIKEIDLLYQ